MGATLLEIEGRFLGERYRFGECLVGSFELSPGSRKSAEKVGHNGDVIAIKGDADPDELDIRQSYRLFGRFANYHNRRAGVTEKQFHFQTFVLARAHDKDGVIAYLEGVGRGQGVGRATAAQIWERFGADSVRMIREDPELLREINPRLTDDRLRAIQRRLVEQAATEDATIELTNLLNGRGLPKTTARKAIKKWGNKAAEIIRRDPYSLMAFRGCGFKLCDSLWLELGHSPFRLRRQALSAWYAIASNTEGHTWYPLSFVTKAIEQSIGSANVDVVKAIKLAVRLGRISPDHYGALALRRTVGQAGPITDDKDQPGVRVWLAEGRRAKQEESIADYVAEAIDETNPRSFAKYGTIETEEVHYLEFAKCQRCGRRLTAPKVHVVDGMPYGPTCIEYVGQPGEVVTLNDWIEQHPETKPVLREVQVERVDLPEFSLWPDPALIKGIDDHQREKLADALVSRIAVVGGSPGTGKTFATAKLVQAIVSSGLVSMADIAVGAPTGKAAVRITAAMQQAGVNLRARTWHSLLGVGVSDDESGDWGFLHNRKNRWSYRVIIGDESSMIDTALMSSILAARPRGCHVLFVGDVHQLPPVGTGAPLRDLIASNAIGYGELTEIKRNSGGIVEACAAIRDGKPWSGGDNLQVIEQATPDDQMAMALRVIRRAQSKGYDPVWDCQVLVAVNAKSKLSRKEVNQRLQAELNPNPEVKGCPFRLADKVVCLKNGYYTSINPVDPSDDNAGENNQVFVANGELARVVEIEPKCLIVELSSPDRTIRVPRGGKSDGDDSSATGCSWDLAYGLSVHKSQGSEWPIVITMIDEYPGARMICSREWLYTAISRGKDKTFLIGKKLTADGMCARVAIGKRRTLLRELIQRGVFSRTLQML